MSKILELSVAERIRLAQDIWESVEELPDTEVLTEVQRQALDRRLEKLERNPDEGTPWRQVLAEIRGKE